MKDQTTAFAEIPGVAQEITRWVCTRCGNDDQRGVWADLTRPSLDQRYAVGFCESCAPTRKSVRGMTRETVVLIRADLFDRAGFVARAAASSDQKLLTKFRRGYPLTEDEVQKVRQIMDRLESRK